MKTGQSKRAMQRGLPDPGDQLDLVVLTPEDMEKMRAKRTAPLLTDWIPCTTPPVRDGEYELKLISLPDSCLREEFKGGQWKDCQGINSDLESWVWRGVRRWVLSTFDPLNTGNGGAPSYLIKISTRGVQYWTDKLEDAMGFDSHVEAYAYTERKTRAPMRAVMAVRP